MSKSKNPDAYSDAYAKIISSVLETGTPVTRILPEKEARWLQADYHGYGRAPRAAKIDSLLSLHGRVICRITPIDNRGNYEVSFSRRSTPTGTMSLAQQVLAEINATLEVPLS